MEIATITLHQPWASMMALGYKRIETRSWQVHATGVLAIHAARTTAWLNYGRMWANTLGLAGDLDFPLGAVVALVRLERCIPTDQVDFADFGPHEKDLGDFSPGRWAWITSLIWALPDPYYVRGRQGLWKWKAPKDVIRKLKSETVKGE